MNIQNFLLLFGSVIFLGILSQYGFRRTHIPTLVLLIGAGLLLGFSNTYLDRELLMEITPYLGVVALLLILFEGGWELEIAQIFRGFKIAFFFGTSYFLLCWTSTLVVALTLLNFPISSALVLAFVLAGSSPSAVTPTLAELAADRATRNLFSMEATFGEILTVLGSLVMIEVMKDGPHARSLPSFSAYCLGSLGIALVLSVMAGILWSRLMSAFGREPLAYMFTLAFLCMLYSATNALGGEGSLSVLAFGFLLGNARWFAHRASPFFNGFFSRNWRQKHAWLSGIIHKINSELTFLVRTFFFVLLGFIFDVGSLSLTILCALGLLLASFFLARMVVCWVFYRLHPELSILPPRTNLALVARGLANAVMVFMAADAGVARSSEMLTLVLGVILGTNLLTAALTQRLENWRNGDPRMTPVARLRVKTIIDGNR